MANLPFGSQMGQIRTRYANGDYGMLHLSALGVLASTHVGTMEKNLKIYLNITNISHF